MSDQNPTPDREHRDDLPEGAEQNAPTPPSDTTYNPPQYGQGSTAHGQQAYEPPRYDGQAPQQPQGGYAPPAYGQQDPAAQPYQAPQYGQQGAPQQGYAAQQYGQQQPYGQQQYGQQQYGQQQYPAPQYQQQYPPAGYQQQWPTEPAPPQSNMLGLVGLGIVAVCAAALAIVAYIIGGQMGQFMLDYGVDTVQNPDPNDPMIIALTQRIQGPATIGMLATFAGIAGWIVSIIAASRRRGRTFAIWGIILGILAPIIGAVAFIAGMWPAAQVLAG